MYPDRNQDRDAPPAGQLVRPSQVSVYRSVSGPGTKARARFPLTPACRQIDGTFLGRLFGLRVDLEDPVSCGFEGEELRYRITVENTTGDELRDVRLLETWVTDGPRQACELRTLELSPLAPGARCSVEHRSSLRPGVVSIVVSVSARGAAPGLFLASDRLRRLVLRRAAAAEHSYRPAA